MTLSDLWYGRLKWLTLIFIPALSAFYFGISQITGLPWGGEVSGILALTATFLGTLIGLSQRNLNKQGVES